MKQLAHKLPPIKHNNSVKGDFPMKYVCELCGWSYDEAEGYPEGDIVPGTKWEDVPEDFVCPVCMANKDQFYKD